MQILGSATTGATENRAATAHVLDTASIVTKVGSIKEARALPPGAVVGDLHGGLTFTDAVARDAYLTHPDHEQVKQTFLPDVESVIAFDYEEAAR